MMLSSRWPTVARVEVEPQREGAVELADRALAVEDEAGQRAGLQDADQVLGVARERQPVDLALHGLRPQPGVAQREGPQRRGQVGPLRGRAGDLVDHRRQAEVAPFRDLPKIGPELLLELDRGADLPDAHRLADHAPGSLYRLRHAATITGYRR
jgi:hypothetical protein